MSKSDNYWSPLIICSWYGHYDLVKCLIEEQKVDPNESKNKGRTALMAATRNNHFKIVKYLIEVAKAEPNKPDDEGWTAFMIST